MARGGSTPGSDEGGDGESKKVNFALVIHNHQPVDNPDEIIESVYRRAYLPFLRKLSEFPQVKANLHYSGYLLEWIERRHPELVALLREMVDSEQVEVIGGGYYEPILPTIPDRDAEGQLRLESKKIGSMFGSQPSGAWMTERAWEPQSPELLRSCGIGYTLLDDTIFERSGIAEAESRQPYLVESRGSVVTVFPMSKRLRYLIPWKKPSEAVSHLGEATTNAGDTVVVFGDDGEKFGAWPTTQDIVYRDGWLEDFFEALTKGREWLNLVTLSRYLSENPATRRTYLPTSSYDEMMDWSMPAESTVRGTGFWRLFLAKYPESRRLYAKMLSVSEQVESLEGEKGEAQRELWKGQCNDAYWHGVFGGLYSPVLRRITYRHLLAAQSMAESRLMGRGPWTRVARESFDGSEELLVQTTDLAIRVCPEAGGSLSELGLKEVGANLFDVVARRKERYHDDIKRAMTRRAARRSRSIHDQMPSKTAGLRGLLVYDRYPRHSFLDHLVDRRSRPKDLLSQDYGELATLSGGAYLSRVSSSRRGVTVDLSRSLGDGARLSKRLAVEPSGMTVRMAYRLNFPHGPPSSRLLVEVNLASLGDDHFYETFSRPGAVKQVTSADVEYRSLGLRARLDFSRRLDLWTVPVKTVSQSESGFEGVLQGVSLVPSLEVTEKETAFEVSLSASPG